MKNVRFKSAEDKEPVVKMLAQHMLSVIAKSAASEGKVKKDIPYLNKFNYSAHFDRVLANLDRVIDIGGLLGAEEYAMCVISLFEAWAHGICDQLYLKFEFGVAFADKMADSFNRRFSDFEVVNDYRIQGLTQLFHEFPHHLDTCFKDPDFQRAFEIVFPRSISNCSFIFSREAKASIEGRDKFLTRPTVIRGVSVLGGQHAS